MPIDPLLFRKKHQEELAAESAGIETPASLPVPASGGDVPTSMETHQAQLNKLDELIQSESGINSFNMDTVRSYVRTIMTDLKNQPELDAIWIDRDVHNILHFIRTVKDSATMVKVEKKAKKAEKNAKKVRFKINFNEGDMPSGLKDLSNFKA